MPARNRPRFFILIVLLIILVAAGAVIWQFGGGWARRILVEQLEARLPGSITVGAPMQWQLVPPVVRLSALRWRAPAGERGQVGIRELTVSTEWAGDGLAGARPVRIDITGVRAELFEDAAGHWVLPRPAGTGTADDETIAWTLAGLSFGDSRLVLNPQAAAPVTLNVERAIVEPDHDTGAELNVSAQVERLDDAVQGSLAATLQLHDGAVALAPFTLTLKSVRGALAGASVQIDGVRLRVDPAGTASAEAVTARAQIPHDAQRAELQADIAAAQFVAGALAATITRFDLTLPPPADATLSLREAALSAAYGALSVSPLAGTLHWQGAEAAVDVALTDGEARYDIAEHRIDAKLRDWRVQLPDPARPGARVELSGAVDGQFWPETQRGAGSVQAQVESSRLTGQWQIDRHQVPWARVAGRIDALDLDRWLPRQAGKSTQAAPLDAWRDLPLQLDLHVGALRWQGLRVRDARLQLNADEKPQPRAE